MNSLNQCQFIGNLGKDPEVKEINGNKVAQFSLACSESYTNKAGEKIDATEWVNIVAWGKLAEIIEKWVKKGDKVYVSGKHTTRQYEKDGVKHFSVAINADSLLMLGSKPTDQNQLAQSAPERIKAQDESPDDLPF
jgi:single-strand DNA-binding protein